MTSPVKRTETPMPNETELLRRMLSLPPKPHKPKPESAKKKPAKK